MLAFISAILNLMLSIARTKKCLICENAILRIELDILKRRDTRKKVTTNGLDRVFVVLLNRAMALRDRISIVRPNTVLGWERNLIKRSGRSGTHGTRQAATLSRDTFATLFSR